MSEESKELLGRISRLSDDELLDMIANAKDYRLRAIEFAKSQLSQRGVNWSEAVTAEVEAADDNEAPPAEEDSDSRSMEPSATGLSCPLCGGRLRPGALVAEKELTIIFSDNSEERFIKVNACSRCGQIWLLADYSTEVGS